LLQPLREQLKDNLLIAFRRYNSRWTSRNIEDRVTIAPLQFNNFFATAERTT